MKFTKSDLENLHPCQEALEFAAKYNFDWEILWLKIDRSDWLLWILQRTKQIRKDQAVKISIACAEHVLCHWEKRHPKDKRPRKAIAAAKKYLANPSAKNKKAAFAAADAAYCAARAANCYAAFAAATADAAYAPATALSAAASSASACAYAAASACAAAAVAAKTSRAEQKWQCKKIREIIGKCPFLK
jgi:hypothetical protein